MPKLIQNITGFVYLPESGTAYLTKGIEGQVGQGDYFKVFGLEVFQQDFSKVEDADVLIKPARFGLASNSGKTMKTILIDK